MRPWLGITLALLILLPTPLRADDWTTRGSGPQRSQTSPEVLGAVNTTIPVWVDPVQTGATGSQPIVVGDKLYHLGGQSLWEIDLLTGAKSELAVGLGLLSDGSWRPSTSSITYANVGGHPLLYFGTGSNSLCVIDLQTYQSRCRRLHPDSFANPRVMTPPSEEPIVATPLVMTAQVDGRETDFVVIGDKEGRIWYFQGFGLFDKAQPYYFNYFEYGGWLLASMVEVTGRPLTFICGSTNGKIQAYQITPGRSGLGPTLVEAWDAKIWSPGQIADGFAKAQTPTGEAAFALDSKGNLQFILTASGRNQVLHLEGVQFTNTSPAIDAEHIYLSIRTTTNGKGALIAVDRATFKEVWRKDLDFPANTNPLVLTDPAVSAVLVGDIKGHLYAFKTSNGEPADLFLYANGKTIAELNNIPGTLDPLGETYQTLTGLSETILASGSTGQPLLITGISGRLNGKPDGYLVAYGTKQAFDASWIEPKLNPQTGTAQVRLTTQNAIDGVPINFYFQPQSGAPIVLQSSPTVVDMAPNKVQTISYTLPANLGPGKVVGVINPGAVAEKGLPESAMILAAHTPPPPVTAKGVEPEAYLANNVIEGAISGAPDLAVTLQASPTYDCLGDKTATVTFQSAAPLTVKATVRVRLGTKTLLSGTLNLSPGATKKALTLAGLRCGSSATLEATIAHADPTLQEQDLTNNQASATVQVSGAQSASGDGPEVIMVPEDCEVNPDWTSDQPCLNYPGLRIP